jgi:hypothetical protein
MKTLRVSQDIDGIGLEWIPTLGKFVVNGKVVDLKDIVCTWDDQSEGWLIPDTSAVTALTRREQNALEDFISCAYNDAMKPFWSKFVNQI